MNENPFQYDGANNLPEDMILDVFIDDHNHARFIQSEKNIFLWGERGSGKTMTLLYYSFPLQAKLADKENKLPPLNRMGIYVPCNTPLVMKEEYRLLGEFKASVVSEHFLALSIAHALASTAAMCPKVFEGADFRSAKSELAMWLGMELAEDASIFADAKRRIESEIVKTQQRINLSSEDGFYENAQTFLSAVMPLMRAMRFSPRLASAHFMLMIDDAHDLNLHQRRALNSWISYRDRSLFSFKVAAARTEDYDFKTSAGGTILEVHDYISVDLEQPYQNAESSFGMLAKRVIERRLKRAGIASQPEKFFPEHPDLARNLDECRVEAEKEAKQRIEGATDKQIEDYVYKYARALYFRKRPPKANLPPYSGFDTIVHLSSGVVRNLLDPCFWMYDEALSRSKGAPVSEIRPALQTEIIQKRSDDLWNRLRQGLDKEIVDCTEKQARSIYKLFDNLAVLFRERLLHHKSEPRAVAFSISSRDSDLEKELLPLLNIARRAQLLYVRSGTAKERGAREDYYVPNKMLWPSRGLDPHGQHARVSLKAKDILAAANGKPFPYTQDKADAGLQQEIFLG